MKKGKYKPRWTYQEVCDIFKKEGYKLLETKFINASTKMKCECPKKHTWETTLSGFKYGYRCKECSGKRKYTYREIFNYFESKKCKLLSKTYKGNNHKLKYKCKCGNLAYVRFRAFKEGSYCKLCSNQRSNDTNKKNHEGRLYFQTEEGKKQIKQTNLEKYGVEKPMQSKKIKEKREQTNLEKYGVKHVSQDKHIRDKQKKGMKEKYGVEYALQIPEAKDKLKQTLLERYGVPSLAYLSRPSSKQSQKLLWAIHNKMAESLKIKNHFAELNGEFTIQYENKYYKYDFVNSKLKKSIEYNGKSFHPLPEQKNNEKGWCAFHPNKTVKEAKLYEKHKYNGLEVRGYEILTVWDFEYRKDFDKLVDKCLNFILS